MQVLDNGDNYSAHSKFYFGKNIHFSERKALGQYNILTAELLDKQCFKYVAIKTDHEPVWTWTTQWDQLVTR